MPIDINIKSVSVKFHVLNDYIQIVSEKCNVLYKKFVVLKQHLHLNRLFQSRPL